MREPKRIAVLRANAVGDFVFALPALDALRAAFPRAEIVLLGKEWHRRFLERRPGPVDRVAVVPLCKGVNEERVMQEDPEEIERFCEEMRREQFDVALQMHGGGRYSNPFLLRLNAGFTAGLKSPDAVPLDRWVPYVYFQSEIVRYLEVSSLIGAVPTCLEPKLAVIASDLAEAERSLDGLGGPFAVVNPAAGDGRRRWPPEKFAAICDALSNEGLGVVVHGSPWECELVDRVGELAACRPRLLRGELTLNGLVGLLARARLLISNDSGPLHLAAAVSTPSIGLYWCGNVINCCSLTRTHSRPLISWQLVCSRCGRNCISDNCEHHESFVAGIETAEVMAAARELLAMTRPQPRL